MCCVPVVKHGFILTLKVEVFWDVIGCCMISEFLIGVRAQVEKLNGMGWVFSLKRNN